MYTDTRSCEVLQFSVHVVGYQVDVLSCNWVEMMVFPLSIFVHIQILLLEKYSRKRETCNQKILSDLIKVWISAASYLCNVWVFWLMHSDSSNSVSHLCMISSRLGNEQLNLRSKGDTLVKAGLYYEKMMSSMPMTAVVPSFNRQELSQIIMQW